MTMFWTKISLCYIIRPLAFVLLVFSSILTYFILTSPLQGIRGDLIARFPSPNLGYINGMAQSTALCRIAPLRVKKQILLVTYGRSGSTFTSALINHHDDIFFVFEPLVVLSKYVLRNNNEHDSVAITKAFLDCDIPAQYAFALNSFLTVNSHSTKHLYKCMHSLLTGVPHVSCFLRMLEDCRRHRVTFIKTIRFRVKWAESLLARNPDFKLLYLVRDPRATLFSQARVFHEFNWRTQIYNISQQHCSLLATDLQDAERLHRLYPGQVKGIRYEHGATNTLSYAKDIYNFLGLSFDDAFVDYITNITTSNDTGDYGIIRHNSTETMNTWRLSITFKNVREIDKACGHLYSKLGYKPIFSQAYLESEKPLFVSPEPGGILTD